MNFYNENEPRAAAWLRELITAGLIAPGVVDERSITEIQPEELYAYTQCHFFAGVAGWPLAFRLAGIADDEPAWTGSCPCQPFSAAGAGRGESDERHLWPAFFRLIEACGPRVVYGEQVSSAAVIGKVVRKMRKGEGIHGLQEAQQRRIQRNVQVLRESRIPGFKAREFSEKEGISGEEATDAPRICADPRSGEASEREGDPVQLGLEGYSSANRSRDLRSNGAPIRFDDADVVGRAIPGSNNSERWIHTGKHPRGALLPQHDGEHLGNRNDPEDRKCHGEETVAGCVERIISENRGESEEEAQRVWIDGIRTDLGRAHYTVGVSVLAACSVSTPHIRQRAFWVAYASGLRGAQQLDESRERSRRGPGQSDASERAGLGWMANTQRDGGRADESRRSEEERASDGRIGRLADSERTRLEGHARNVNDRNQPGRNGTNSAGSTSEGCGFGYIGLADAEDSDRRSEQQPGEPARNGRRGPSGSGTWSDFDIIQFRDGKARRIESGTFPLVDGLPRGVVPSGDPSIQEVKATSEARQMRLRGYGNAIVPQLAAAFIGACREVIPTHPLEPRRCL